MTTLDSGSDLPFNHEKAEEFLLFCLTCSSTSADHGSEFYALIWLLVASKVELKRRLHNRSSECLAWQSEVVNLRERTATLERAAEPMRRQIRTLTADKKHLQKLNQELVRRVEG